MYYPFGFFFVHCNGSYIMELGPGYGDRWSLEKDTEDELFDMQAGHSTAIANRICAQDAILQSVTSWKASSS